MHSSVRSTPSSCVTRLSLDRARCVFFSHSSNGVLRKRTSDLEREQYLLNFVGSRLEGGGSASMMSSAASSRAGTPQPSGYCDFVSIQLEWRRSCDDVFTSFSPPSPLLCSFVSGESALSFFSRLCQVSLIFPFSFFGFYTSFIRHNFGPRLFSASIWYSYLSLSFSSVNIRLLFVGVNLSSYKVSWFSFISFSILHLVLFLSHAWFRRNTDIVERSDMLAHWFFSFFSHSLIIGLLDHCTLGNIRAK